MEDGGGVGSVHSTVTFRGHVEGRLGVLWEASEEQLEEGIYVLSSCGASVDRGTVIRVGISDVDGLVEEKDIAVRVPRVFIVRHARFIGDLTRAQLEEQSRC